MLRSRLPAFLRWGDGDREGDRFVDIVDTEPEAELYEDTDRERFLGRSDSPSVSRFRPGESIFEAVVGLEELLVSTPYMLRSDSDTQKILVWELPR
jgi:hypothetical protein